MEEEGGENSCVGRKQRLLSRFYRETTVRAETESEGPIAVSVLCPLNVVSVAFIIICRLCVFKALSATLQVFTIISP